MDTALHKLVVPRTARYATLGAIDEGIGEAWMLCHGYGQLGMEFLESARALSRPGRLLVAPEGMSRFYHEDHETIGASWMTREDRESEMEDYVRYLDLVYEQSIASLPGPPLHLSVLGFSQGVATATRWAARGQAKVDHLLLWGAAVPPEFDRAETFEPLRGTRITLVCGSRDRLFPESSRDEQRTRLREHGVDFTEVGFEGGHRLDDDTLVALAQRPE